MSFDWALKRLLRDKANFDVLEGFISTLLNNKVRIHRLLEGEGNKDRDDAKYNRVDLLAMDESGELILVEVQGEPEYAYFQRMLFGTSRLVTEYINGGQNYDNIKKIYAINIVYFDLGQGQDNVYYGKTEFRGIHNNEVLRLNPFQRQRFKVNEVYELYPEYYILKVNDFNRWSKVPLEQWMYFLATSEIPDDADAPGLPEAREKLRFIKMSREDQIEYDRYQMDRKILKNQMITARGEARLEGREEGLAEGREQGLVEGREEGIELGVSKANAEMARRMREKGFPTQDISELTGLTVEQIDAL